MQFRGGMNELLRQASRMQRKVEETRKAHELSEVTATSGGDKVKATVTYAGRLARIEVDPEFWKAEGPEMVTDCIAAAVNSAIELAEKAMSAEIEKATGGAKIPGFT